MVSTRYQGEEEGNHRLRAGHPLSRTARSALLLMLSVGVISLFWIWWGSSVPVAPPSSSEEITVGQIIWVAGVPTIVTAVAPTSVKVRRGR